MARLQVADPLHNYKFRAEVISGPDFLVYKDDSYGEAGFNSITTPSMTTEAVEYKEGTHTYTRKFPGNPTFDDVTFSRGATLRDTKFYEWVKRAVEGGEYRADIQYYHYHRSAMLSSKDGNSDFDNEKAKLYVLYNAVPIRCKVAGDLDATSSDISLAELDVAYEYFDVETPTT